MWAADLAKMGSLFSFICDKKIFVFMVNFFVKHA